MADHTQVIVSQIPLCDFCPPATPVAAYADAKLNRGPGLGSWAHVCKKHFTKYQCKLGLGLGQQFVLRARDE